MRPLLIIGLLIASGLMLLPIATVMSPSPVLAQTNTTTNTTTITNTNTNTTMPSDQEIQTEIAQASPTPDYDTLVNQGIDNCIEWFEMGNNPFEVACDIQAMTEERNLDCEIYENQLLVCNPNSKLAQKFYAYLNMTTQ